MDTQSDHSQNPFQGNPFVLPGLGQNLGQGLGQDTSGQNPLLASMEMMRQAWQNMTGSGMFQQPFGPGGPSALTTEDLDRRIADMRAVEGWLKLNLSMLASSIQALEVQRATLSTLKSYMGFATGGTGAAASQNPSPLDVALGIKPSGQAKIKSAKSTRAEGGADTVGQDEKTAAASKEDKESSDAVQPFSEAAQAWWKLLQQQFNTLTAATEASMQVAADAKTATGQDCTQMQTQTQAQNQTQKPEKSAARNVAAMPAPVSKNTPKNTPKTVSKTPSGKTTVRSPRKSRTA